MYKRQEYNCRFGDPEAQVVLSLLRTDLLTVMRAVVSGTLDRVPVEWSPESACCLVLASNGYPQKYPTGFPISGLERGQLPGGGATVYHAGVKAREDGTLVTAGGRVLGITATAPTLAEAVGRAYRAADGISFEGLRRRSDIGRRALAAQRSTDDGRETKWL